jgi:hypothetical protein
LRLVVVRETSRYHRQPCHWNYRQLFWPPQTPVPRSAEVTVHSPRETPVNRTYRIIVALLLTMAATATAQRIDTIKANPDAKPLRKIWQVTGGEFGGGKVGDGFGSCGDINGDSIEDWAVHYGTAYQWRIYYGSRGQLDTAPVTIIKGVGALTGAPVVGDFWGTGHKAVGFASTHSRVVNGNTFFFFEFHIFRTDSNRLDTVAAAILDVDKMSPPSAIAITNIQVQAADLDGDGADELILFTRGLNVGSHIGGIYPDILIYRGGPKFRVDTPTVVVHDTEKNGGNASLSLTIAHADDDAYLDLVTGSDYSDGVNKAKFYFGSEGSPWNWSQPDRVVPMGGLFSLGGFIPLDCDGDGMLDMLVGGEDYRVSLFLSSSGKDIRTRTLTSDDLDLTFRASTYYCYPSPIGYLSDSSHRYAMLAVNVGGTSLVFSGGPHGPDSYYDSYTGELYGRVIPVGDLNGDGWDEMMTGNSTVNFDAGIAMIYAGGPYIPRDPSLGVRAVTGEGHSNAISIWPNPATTELHIAWRGDLKRMPRRFAVHDLLGKLIAQGEIESWRGQTLWQCEDAPAGTYILSIMDYQGELIATERVIKQ